MISKELALKIFEAFSIERWNDMIRPFDVVEMDKAAEKMMIAYIIGKFEEAEGRVIDWEWMIYASVFDLFRKIALCDIKSPVQRMIRQEYPFEYKKINEWVLSQYSKLIDNKDILNRFSDYLLSDEKEKTLTSRVLRASHKYSAIREFEMLSLVNEPIRLEKVRKALNQDIDEFLDLRGLQLIITKQRPYELLVILEQLRFQTRWNQTPRVPRTSVMGHCMFTAIFTLFLTLDCGVEVCSKRLYNNFFSALFHDFPEAVTRDIISPVKQATEGFPLIVKSIEEEIVKRDLRPLMEDFYADELLYFTNDEFSNRVCLDSDYKKAKTVTFEELNTLYNISDYNPVDGKLVRCADHIAAFMEADSSIKHGITSAHLQEGRENTKNLYPRGNLVNGVDIGEFFDLFSDK